MKDIDLEHLLAVSGGMHWQDFRPSTNVEDRRGWSRWKSLHAPSPMAPPLPPLTRSPNDLSHQAGLDDIKLPPRHHR